MAAIAAAGWAAYQMVRPHPIDGRPDPRIAEIERVRERAGYVKSFFAHKLLREVLPRPFEAGFVTEHASVEARSPRDGLAIYTPEVLEADLKRAILAILQAAVDEEALALSKPKVLPPQSISGLPAGPTRVSFIFNQSSGSAPSGYLPFKPEKGESRERFLVRQKREVGLLAGDLVAWAKGTWREAMRHVSPPGMRIRLTGRRNRLLAVASVAFLPLEASQIAAMLSRQIGNEVRMDARSRDLESAMLQPERLAISFGDYSDELRFSANPDGTIPPEARKQVEEFCTKVATRFVGQFAASTSLDHKP